MGLPGCCTVTLYVGEGSDRAQWCLLRSLPVFNHFPHYPQAKWALLVLIPMWVGLCTFWDPSSLSSEFSCEAGSFSRCCLEPQGVFNQRFEVLFPCAGTLELRSLFRSPFVPPGLSASECGIIGSTGHHLASPPSCVSLPLLLVWMNVSSLTPWLSDFHIVQFSGSSGCFLFLYCCPSLGCARRRSVSTYASILAGSLVFFFHTFIYALSISISTLYYTHTHRHQRYIQGEAKQIHSCEYAKHKEFLYYYLLIIIFHMNNYKPTFGPSSIGCGVISTATSTSFYSQITRHNRNSFKSDCMSFIYLLMDSVFYSTRQTVFQNVLWNSALLHFSHA